MVKDRVVVAMSGGVDSSVAAALLVEQGHDVVGLMLRLWSEADNGSGPSNRCCALDAQYDAERVAARLDIPFYVINVAEAFKQHVVDYFVAEYATGRTPNPCVECNRHIRFDALLRRALALDAGHLATGHYARIQLHDDKYQLWRGVDPGKDQSYVLHVLRQAQLAHALFPLGELTKQQVRAMARDRGLPVAERQESQDLCFVADGDYRRFLAERAPETATPGPIRDRAGRVLGRHRGLASYTVGQRKGIDVAGTDRLYVLALDPADNALIVGAAGELGQETCLAQRVNWIAGEPPGDAFEATAKIRYKARDAAVSVRVEQPNQAWARFHTPQRDITPGQAIVFYQGDRVLGGGVIARPDDAQASR